MLLRPICQTVGLAVAALATSGLTHAQTVLTASSWLAPTHTLSETQKEWCGEIEKKTAGKRRARRTGQPGGARSCAARYCTAGTCD